jgi:low temperature requirement protein LtrA
MATRSVASPHDQSATFVELFFDLVFVFGITQVVSLLYHDMTWTGALRSVLVFWLLWWAWTQFTWALNAADTEHPWVEFGTLLATAVAFFMAVAVPEAFSDGVLWFAVPYVVVRVIGLAIYVGVMRENEAGQRVVRQFATTSLGGLVAVLMGAYVGGESQAMFWLLVILLDMVAASAAGAGAAWGIHAEHFAERHGLIVIIALGEGLIVAASGLVGAERTPTLLLVGALAVAITCALWWSYFPVAKPELERSLVNATDDARAPMARDAFSFAHFPMLCGVIAYAVAIEGAIGHPADALATPQRISLAAGLLLFVGGLAVALGRASCTVRTSRVVVAVVTAAAVYFFADVPAAVSLGIAFAGVATVALLEERLAERLKAQ